MANTCDILGWVNMGEPFFMILSSIQMGSGSFSASAWKVCFRKASAKNMNTFTKNILRPLPPCVYHGSCKTITSYKARNICLYTISLYDVHMKCKRHNDKFLQNARPWSFHIKKNVKIASASVRDGSTVRVFDWYVQILHSEHDSKKKRNSFVPSFKKIGYRATLPQLHPSF